MSKGTTRRTVRVPDELWTAAQEVAIEREDDLSRIIRQALRLYIDANTPEVAEGADHAA